MYKIGTKQERWIVITNGEDIFEATDDLRYYSKPPCFQSHSVRLLNDSKNENRVTKLTISQTDFDAYCKSNGLETRGCATSGEKARKMATPLAIGAIVGAVVGGPVGAAVGAGIFGFISSGSDFNSDNLSSVFLRAKEHALEWERYDHEHAIYKKEQRDKYIIKAKENWARYYKIKNISNLDELTGIEFEAAIANLYEHKGYEVQTTKASGDFGIDIIAKKGSEILAIQTKRYIGKVGIKAVQEVSAGAFYYKATKAVVITNSFYTDPAKELAKKTGVTIIDKKRLATMWVDCHPSTDMPDFDLQQYEKLENQIKNELYRTESAAGRKYDKRSVNLT